MEKGNKFVESSNDSNPLDVLGDVRGKYGYVHADPDDLKKFLDCIKTAMAGINAHSERLKKYTKEDIQSFDAYYYDVKRLCNEYVKHLDDAKSDLDNVKDAVSDLIKRIIAS